MMARGIIDVWVFFTFKYPSKNIVIDAQEVHYYASIKEYDNRCLKVVVNPEKHLVITTFFDRKMRQKGC